MSFSLTLLLTLEFAVRIFFPREERIEQILSILNEDTALFWRQKNNLNTLFQGAPITTNSLGFRNGEIKKEKEKNSFRIICMGASPTFGWGVLKDDTYPCKLEKKLQGSMRKYSKVEVINAGEIGYTSYQGLKLLRDEIIQLEPDMITVSYVLNDVDKYRFFRSNGKSDNELLPKNKLLVNCGNLLRKSKLYRLLKRIILSESSINSFYLENPEMVPLDKRRVSEKDYAENLSQFVDFARSNSLKLIFIKMPVNLQSSKNIPSNKEAAEEAEALVKHALLNNKGKNNKASFAELIKAAEIDPSSGKALYFLSLYARGNGNKLLSEKYLKLAREKERSHCEYFGGIYNSIMEKIAKEKNIPMVDIVEAFKNYNKNDPSYLFLDPKQDTIHPNALGHRIISDEIFRAVLELEERLETLNKKS